jgi:flavin reductase (DIM6/NTAB) family NADH-FMN oxidoreductase RutF
MIDSDIHRLLISGIVQRPIAFVSISEESVENLAPFSWFNNEQYTKTWLFIAYNFIP